MKSTSHQAAALHLGKQRRVQTTASASAPANAFATEELAPKDKLEHSSQQQNPPFHPQPHNCDMLSLSTLAAFPESAQPWKYISLAHIFSFPPSPHVGVAGALACAGFCKRLQSHFLPCPNWRRLSTSAKGSFPPRHQVHCRHASRISTVSGRGCPPNVTGVGEPPRSGLPDFLLCREDLSSTAGGISRDWQMSEGVFKSSCQSGGRDWKRGWGSRFGGYLTGGGPLGADRSSWEEHSTTKCVCLGGGRGSYPSPNRGPLPPSLQRSLLSCSADAKYCASVCPYPSIPLQVRHADV